MQCKVKTFRIAQLQNMLFAQFVQFVSKVYILNVIFLKLSIIPICSFGIKTESSDPDID